MLLHAVKNVAIFSFSRSAKSLPKPRFNPLSANEANDPDANGTDLEALERRLHVLTSKVDRVTHKAAKMMGRSSSLGHGSRELSDQVKSLQHGVKRINLNLR